MVTSTPNGPHCAGSNLVYTSRPDRHVSSSHRSEESPKPLEVEVVRLSQELEEMRAGIDNGARVGGLGKE